MVLSIASEPGTTIRPLLHIMKDNTLLDVRLYHWTCIGAVKIAGKKRETVSFWRLFGDFFAIRTGNRSQACIDRRDDGFPD
jgi:hypothetical protein